MSDAPSAGFGGSSYGGGAGDEEISVQTLQLQQISLNARILRQTNPWMGERPDVLMDLAMSGLPPDQLASQGASLYGMQSMDALRQSIGGLTPAGQRSVYGRLTEQQQRALDQMGYEPPGKDNGWGVLGDVGKGVGFALSPVVKGVSTVAGPPLKGAMDMLTWIGDQPAHLYRAIRLQDDWVQWAALAGAAVGAGLVIGLTGGLATMPMLMMAGAVGGGALAGATGVAAVTAQDEWWDALNQTWDGEKVFERGAQRQARGILQTDELMTLAKSLALEVTPYELATEVASEGSDPLALQKAAEKVAGNLVDLGTPEYQQIFGGIMTLMQQEPFMRAVDILQNGKISFGRDIGDTLGIDHNNPAYHLISGSIDAFWALSMDPTLMAGAASRANRARRFGVTVGDPDVVEQTLTVMADKSKSMKAVQQQVASAVRSGDFKQMPAAYRGIWFPMREWAADPARAGTFLTDEHFREFIAHGGGLTHMLGGKGTIKGVAQIVMSPVNEQRGWGRFVRELRDFRDEMHAGAQEVYARQLAKELGVEEQFVTQLPPVEDVLKGSLEVNLNPGPGVVDEATRTWGSYVGSPLGYVAGKTVRGYPVRTVANLIQRITTMAPAGRTLRFVGEGSEVDIPRFVEFLGVQFGMKSKARDAWLNHIMVQGAANQRLAVIESFMQNTLSLGGMHSTGPLKELGDQFIAKYHQAYGLGGLDVSVINGVRSNTGLAPQLHQASVALVPDFNEMVRVIRRGHLLKQIARITDSDFVEASMSRFWKPSVLMRIAFIPRAAGEEFLSFMARVTEGGIAQEFGARGIGQRAAYEAAAAERARGVPLEAREYAALRWQVPAHARPLQWMFARRGWKEPVDSGLEDYGRWLFGHLEGGIGYKITDPTYQKGLFGLGSFSPQWWQPMVFGKQHSWRRMILNGVDRSMVDAAETWVNGHADAILAGTSALNSSSFEKSIVNPDIQTFMQADPNNPGQTIEVPYVMMRGERLKVNQDHPQYAAAVHHRIGELFMDDITGRVLANNYPRFLPTFGDLQPAQIVDTIEQLGNVQTNTGKKLILEALQGRNDNWRAAATVLRPNEPLIADAIDELMFGGNNPTIPELVRVLKRDLSGIPDEKDGLRVRQIIDELEQSIPSFETLDTLNPDSKGWLTSGVSAHLSNDGGFYDMEALRGWANGDERYIHRRPKNVLYRGVPNMSTLELRPSKEVPGGWDLVLKPQWQSQWEGDAISLSIYPHQSLIYATDPVSGRKVQIGSGALIEMDGDYVAQAGGRDWDEMMGSPLYWSDPSLDKNLIGAHFIGNTEPTEVAYVTRREGADLQWDVEGLRSEFPNDTDEELVNKAKTLEWYKSQWDQFDDVDDFERAANLGSAGTRAMRDHILQIARDDDIEAAFAEVVRLSELTKSSDVLRRGDELVIPHGKWAMQTGPQMEQWTEEAKQGIHPKWSDIAGLTWRNQAGESVEQIATDFRSNVQQITANLPNVADPKSPVHGLRYEFGGLSDEQLQIAASELAHLATFDNPSEVDNYLNSFKTFGQGRNALASWWMSEAHGLTGGGAGIAGERGTPDEALATLKQLAADHGLTNENALPEVQGSLFSYLQGLDEDTLDIVADLTGQVMKGRNFGGWQSTSISEIHDSALEIILNQKATVDQATEFIEMRGRGAFEFKLPRWAPFQTDRTEFLTGLQNEMHAELMKPENAEWVRKSRHALETSDGRRVAQPLQEGLKRLYVPVRQSTVGSPNGSKVSRAIGLHMDDASSTDELIERVVAELLSDPDALRLHTRWLEQLAPEVRAQALGDAVRAAFTSRATPRNPAGGQVIGAGLASGPLDRIGYEDPRLAQWVSDVMYGAEEPGQLGQYYLDIPRQRGGLDDPMARNQLGTAGHSWAIPESRRMTITHVQDDGIVMLPNGTHSPGVSFQTALKDWADLIVRKMELEHTAGTQESYTVLEEGANIMRRKGDKFVPLTPGEKMGSHGEEELFDAEGAPVRWADERYMQAEATTGDEFMWEVIGPMIRDWHEHQGGFTSRIPKTSNPVSARVLAGEEIPYDEQLINMTRSRIGDIHKGVRGLPNVALAEMKVPPPDRLWDRMIRFGFDKVIGPSLDALVRKPMSFHYYAAARRQNQEWFKHLIDRNLMDNVVPAVFGRQIDRMDELTQITPEQLEAGRKLGRFRDNMPDDVDDVDVARYLAALGTTRGEYMREVGLAKSYAAKNPEMGFTPEEFEPLTSFSLEPIRLMDAGGGPMGDGERFVAAYHRAVPEHIWEKGQDAVNRHLTAQLQLAESQRKVLGASGAFGQIEAGLPMLVTEHQWKTMDAAVRNYRHVENSLTEASKLRALENVVPFIDSHEQRSQFAAIGRNMLPFWYAEENFLKRWARTFAIDGTYGLATIRKGQLGYMGVRSAGLIRTDANGKDWFVYPGSGLLAEALQKLPIIPDTLPVGVMFQADVQSMMPGMNSNFGTPAFSPWIAMPIDGVTRLFPDAQPIERAILGDQAASQSSLNQFVPGTVRRVWEAAFQDEDSSRRYAAAMMAAAAMMEAEGNGLPDSATPDQVEGYLDKLRNHARVVMWAQTITGFVVPGTPIAINTGEDAGSFGWLTGTGIESPDELVSAEYRSYIKNLGIDEGTSRFLADYPNADLEDVVNPLAYTTPTSASVSGAPLPATKHGMQWYNDNKAWVDQMPEAGAWFLPRPDVDEAFNFYSYNQQLQNGLRKQREPVDFVRALKYRNAASGYFDARDQYEALAMQLEGAGAQDKKRQIDAIWETWRTTWLAAHPIFAEELVSGEARERRNRTIEQMRYATSDPQAPQSPQMPAIKQMVEAFDAYRVLIAQLSEARDAKSRDKAKRIREIWDTWANAWVVENPDLEQLWSAVYRPESGL